MTKRTSASWLNTSLASRVALVVACAGVMFWLGRTSAPAQEYLLQQVDSMRHDVLIQQREVDRMRQENSRDINALAVRLAELQAASTRLDALGERLAQMGQLSLDEFDFSDRAPVGGPIESPLTSHNGAGELHSAVEVLSERLRMQASQLDALQFLMVNRQLDSDLTPSGWPLRKGWVSSRYGERNDPFTGERVQHRGLDFGGPAGTDVLSVASGVVVWAGNRGDYGKTIEIDHGNGYMTRYAHNSKLAVNVGDKVAPGQAIGTMGATGRASAPHLHFEVLKNGNRVNPSKFVRKLR